MILSRTNNFIFLKTTKTAGTSFEIALSKYAGPDDVVTPISDEDELTRAQLGYRGPQNYLDAPTLLDRIGLRRQRRLFSNHIPAALVRERIGHEAFGRFYKVAVVRNPYDLTVSRYYWSHRKQGNTSPEHFRKWLLSRPDILRKNFNITHIDGRCAVDFMMRYENLKDDIGAFASKVGLPDTLFAEFSALKAKGHYRPKDAGTSELFSGFGEGKAMVADIFAHDIADYGYTCP